MLYTRKFKNFELIVHVDDQTSIISNVTIHDIHRVENLITFERHTVSGDYETSYVSQIDHPACQYDYSPKLRRRLQSLMFIVDKIMTYGNLYYVRTYIVEKFFTKVI